MVSGVRSGRPKSDGGCVMNIVVVIKQTPDTETVIRIAPGKSQIVTSDIKWIINPYDEFAIEAALRLKEKHGGTVTVISYGPQRVVEALRTALAMGADEAVLIDDTEYEGRGLPPGYRGFGRSQPREKNPDIILIGSRSVDYDQGQRGAILAEKLGWPHVALAVSMESRWDQRDRRTADRGWQSDDRGPSARIGYVRRIACRMESPVRFPSRDHESKEKTSGLEETSGLGIGSGGFCSPKKRKSGLPPWNCLHSESRGK